MTLSEFLAQHLEATKETLKKRTWEGHEETARVHLVPMLGHLKLKVLSCERVQPLYAAKRAGGLSPVTVRRIHAELSATLSRAVRWRLVPYNVCKDADPPRASSPDLRLLNHKEVRAFMVAAEREPHHALYCLALTSGMRRGEILGLRWGCLDLAQRTLRVRYALVAGRGSPTFESPKTAKSRRSIILIAKAVDALERHRERQREAGLSVEDDALVFTSTKGTPSMLRACVSPLKLSLCGPGCQTYVSMTCGTLALPCCSPKVYILKWFRNSWGMPPSRRRFKSTKRSGLVFRALLVDSDAEHLTLSRA